MASPLRWGSKAARTYRRFDPVSWTVENFKAMEHATLPLHRLVTLTGANSSGKSSLIQSLLLLAQSTDDEIILNGPLVRLGDAADVIRSGCDDLSIGYSAWGPPRDNSREEWSFELALAAADQWTLRAKEFFAAVDGEPLLSASSSRVTAETAASINSGNRFGDTILRVREIGGKKAPPRTYISFKGLYPQAFIFRRDPDKVLKQLRRRFGVKQLRANPEISFELFEILQEWRQTSAERSPSKIDELIDSLIHGSATRIMFEMTQHELDEIFSRVAHEMGSEEWVAAPIPSYNSLLHRRRAWRTTTLGLDDRAGTAALALAAAIDSLSAIRNSVRYLGPLREEPQVVSGTGGRNRTSPAGSKGEYTADLLARGAGHEVQFFDSFKKRRRLPLPRAVSIWTTYLGVGESVAVEDQGKLGRGLRLELNGVERDLTTIGVGASQVLPVLAMVLAADQDAIVCLEQPELHLHPAVQSRLADFFLYARPDIKLVVETHSEYLITRIRRRVAEDLTRASDATILFAEQDHGVSTVRSLKLDATGDLSDWPAGFFDTQESDARALVSAVSERTRTWGK
ncbi:AAA family ATPase [Nocardioides albus]|uniref:Energy-coupling factor transporter ATP-binding protein EcfA2 n=1 Tax=Nocardioides albus TaxID=1841 RepID=A0A7W5FAB4_9ACTN|nr:DUF3696 domain-containing protein [Nocardioides albus]MBB3091119.1 energy-coupling factor transporter ATP-binding protein EcfA2 [Nocardioides albus]GGU34218.1 hypothetical protein GCM10007979_36650 [Nocardioides albus]